MKVDTEIKIFNSIAALVVISLVIWLGLLGINKFKNWSAGINERDRISHIKQVAYRSRLPKAGDRVVLNDANVSVIKEYSWSNKFRVRYDNGAMADVAEEEMLDLKKVVSKFPEK